MRTYLNQSVNIPFALNQVGSAANISIMKLSDGTIQTSLQAMTLQQNNIYTYPWTAPKVVEQYQTFINETSTGYTYNGPFIEVFGGMVFTVLTDAGNSSVTFKTDLTETVADFYVGPSLVKWLDGVLLNQTRRVATTGGYSSGSILTMGVAFTSTPADNVTGLLITE